MKITIKDVAKHAGVSITTVSFVINNTNRVSADTKKKVLQAVKDLNYQPNAIAKSLVSKKTHDIALVISGPNYEYLSSSFLSLLVLGIKQICEQYNFHLIIKTMSEETEYEQLSQELMSTKSDGILLWGTRIPDQKLLNLIKKNNTPLVSVGRYIDNSPMYSVVVNNFQGSFLMTEHLIKCGHKRILYLGVLPNVSTGQDRYEGFLSALQTYNIPIDYSLHIPCNFYQKEAYSTINSFLENKKIDFTAIFAASDTMALGVMKALYDHNIKIPQDVALAGFDNIPNSDITIVPLSTVHAPIEELGKKSAEKLIQLINKEDNIPLREQLDIYLKIRDSI